MATKKYATLEEYLEDQPGLVQDRLRAIQSLIKAEAPDAKVGISYNIPAFKQHGYFIYFAGFKNHVSIFPAPGGAQWNQKFQGYTTSGKGTIQFQHDEELPLPLIREIIQYNLQKDQVRKKRP